MFSHSSFRLKFSTHYNYNPIIQKHKLIPQAPSQEVSPGKACSWHSSHCQKQCNKYPSGQVSCSQRIHPSWSCILHTLKRRIEAKEQDAYGSRDLQCNPVSGVCQSSPRISHNPRIYSEGKTDYQAKIGGGKKKRENRGGGGGSLSSRYNCIGL